MPMLINDLFIVDDWRPGDGTLTATLRLQVNHRIFEGHFPGRPVVPGACLVQLVQEMASSVAGVAVRMIRADQIKFITMIEPGRDETIMVTVRGKWEATGEWRVDAEARNAGASCFRFRGIFRAGSDYAG
jgi:3-hydroxyacyl-[acyl-carrier-protein] dehydratase